MRWLRVKNYLIGETKSVCPVCLKVIKAYKVEKERKDEEEIKGIFLDKTCPEHGEYSTLIWEGDATSYLAWNRENTLNDSQFYQTDIEKGCPYDCGLCPEHKQDTCCVLLEVTNQCNLHCPVCFASAGDAVKQEPTLQEIGYYYETLMENGGPFNIQLSGGEPTMRNDLCDIIRLGREKGFSYFQLNTNGIRLGEEEALARNLKRAGLNSVFLQFDSMTEKPYEILRGKPLFYIKEKAIENCAKAGLGVVLVPTLVLDVNVNEIGSILQFAIDNLPDIRGVHFQPISYFGRCGLTAPQRRLTIPRVLSEIEKQTNSVMHANDFQGGSVEHSHCSFHGNFMKQADGHIKAIIASKADCKCSSNQTREFVAKRWSAAKCCKKKEEEQEKCENGSTTSLDDFLERMEMFTLAVSGMVFQDAFNLDLERLQRCKIGEINKEGKRIPFCAYNLTSVSGKSLYRNE